MRNFGVQLADKIDDILGGPGNRLGPRPVTDKAESRLSQGRVHL
jgi:hypothetical protein